MLIDTLRVLVVALLARLLILWYVFVHFPNEWLYSRGIELGLLAHSLADGRGLSSPFGGDTGPSALLAPGYPALIAVFFTILGHFTLSAALAIMAMQILFSLMTVLIIMRITQRYVGAREAKFAGSFWAVSLPIIWMPSIFWDTCLSTLLLLGMMALALHCISKPTCLLWTILGGYSAFASLVNPALLLALLATMVWTAWLTRGASPRLPLFGLLTLVLVFSPWPIRNALQFHAFIPLRSTIGYELWMGNHPGSTGFLEESSFPIFDRLEYSKYVSMGEVAYMGDKLDLARSYIGDHPIEFIRLSAVRVLRFWLGSGNRDGSPIFVIHSLLTTSLGFTGLWTLFRKRRFTLAIFFSIPLLLFPLPYYITHAEFRYRLVIDPLLTILSAYTVGGWINRVGHGDPDRPKSQI